MSTTVQKFPKDLLRDKLNWHMVPRQDTLREVTLLSSTSPSRRSNLRNQPLSAWEG